MAETEKRRKSPSLPRDIMRAVAAAEDRKAADIVLLDLRKAAGFADLLLICSGGNARHIRAIADAVMEALASAGAKPAHVEGYQQSEWILLITSISSSTSSARRRACSTASSDCGETRKGGDSGPPPKRPGGR